MRSQRSTGALEIAASQPAPGCAASVGDYEGVPVSGRWLVQQRGGKRLRRFNHEPYRTSSARPERGQTRSKLEDERLQGQCGRAHVQHDRRRARQIRKQRGGRKSSQENGGMPAATGDLVEQSGDVRRLGDFHHNFQAVQLGRQHRDLFRFYRNDDAGRAGRRSGVVGNLRAGRRQGWTAGQCCQGQQAQEKPDCGWHLSTDRTTAYNESFVVKGILVSHWAVGAREACLTCAC